jgi:ABC-2 type transport system permease protein
MIWTIAKREVVTRGRSKGFLAITGILFLGVIAMAVLLTVLGGGDDAREVTIGIEGDGAAFVDLLEIGDDDLAPTIVTPDDGQLALEEGDIDVLFSGTTLTWEGLPDQGLDTYIRDVAQQAAFGDRATALGVTPQEIGGLFAPVEIEEVRLDGGDDQFLVRIAAAGVAGAATFILIQTWGSFMMMGVIEEKSSKVIEVLLSHVRPSTLLSGKLLGLGLLALGQMLIFVLGMVVALSIVDDVEIPSGVWGSVPVLVLTFILGFGFYATAFAAVGSMVSRIEDAQSAQLPVMLPLIAGYFIGASSFAAPENPAVTIGSFVPFTSPVLLPYRMSLTDMPWWQVALSLAILAVSIVFMVRIAGAIYRYSLLRSGSRVTWREALRNRSTAEL